MVENAGTLSYRTCTGVGPNYVRTFDGLEYLFPGRCHYTVFTDSVRSISVKHIDCHSYQLCRKVNTIRRSLLFVNIGSLSLDCYVSVPVADDIIYAALPVHYKLRSC